MHDHDYCRKRAEQERAAARRRGHEGAEISGHLALAYASLARRLAAASAKAETVEIAEGALLVED